MVVGGKLLVCWEILGVYEGLFVVVDGKLLVC